MLIALIRLIGIKSGILLKTAYDRAVTVSEVIIIKANEVDQEIIRLAKIKGIDLEVGES